MDTTFFFYLYFLQFLKTDYGVVCEVLEPVNGAKAKVSTIVRDYLAVKLMHTEFTSFFMSVCIFSQDEIAQTPVRILQVVGKAKEFLCDIIMSKVEHTGV